jgi:F0F1-type ATP synthase assembly protein I
MIAAMSSTTAGVIGVALLLAAVVVGLVVGPKWWNWRSFVALTLVLFIPLMMSFFIPLPIVIILNVVISHGIWQRKHGAPPVEA